MVLGDTSRLVTRTDDDCVNVYIQSSDGQSERSTLLIGEENVAALLLVAKLFFRVHSTNVRFVMRVLVNTS